MRTEQLSIHKCAIELATLATRILPDMNRAHRGLIGKDIRDAAKAVIKNIRYANESRDQARVDYISAVLDLTESIVIDFRIAFELRLINRGICEAVCIIEKSGYTSCTAETTAGGIGTPVWGGDEPQCVLQAAFFAPVLSSYGRPGGRSRKARGCSIRSSNSRFGRPPLLEQGLAVTNRNWSNEMTSTSFSVRESRTLERASRILEKSLLEIDAEKLSSVASASLYLRSKIGRKKREHFIALWLNTQNRLIASETLFQGSLTECRVYLREVVRSAVENNAAAVIFAHNHPGGSAQPSQADIDLTEELRRTLAVIDVGLLDHFIVTADSICSMVELGLLAVHKVQQ